MNATDLLNVLPYLGTLALLSPVIAAVIVAAVTIRNMCAR